MPLATRQPKRPESWKVQENPMEPRGLQKEMGPKAQVEIETTNDGVSCMTAELIRPLQKFNIQAGTPS